MRKSIVAAVIIAFVAAAAVSIAQDNREPRIAVKEMQYDLGQVVQGIQASHVFEIRNEGAGTLVIERVQPG